MANVIKSAIKNAEAKAATIPQGLVDKEACKVALARKACAAFRQKQVDSEREALQALQAMMAGVRTTLQADVREHRLKCGIELTTLAFSAAAVVNGGEYEGAPYEPLEWELLTDHELVGGIMDWMERLSKHGTGTIGRKPSLRESLKALILPKQKRKTSAIMEEAARASGIQC